MNRILAGSIALSLNAPGPTQAQSPADLRLQGFYANVDMLGVKQGGTNLKWRGLGKGEARFTSDASPSADGIAKRFWVLDVGINAGAALSSASGDSQGPSNIEAPTAFKIYDFYYQSSRANGDYWTLGILDLNTIFYGQGDGAAYFLNSSHGIGPEISHTGLNGPSVYPNSGAAVAGQATLWSMDHAGQAQRIVGRLGVFDGVPNSPDHPRRTTLKLSRGEGALVIGEAQWIRGQISLTAGLWSYTAAFDKLDGSGMAHGNAGSYVIAQYNPSSDSHGWVTLGRSRTVFNDVNSYFGAGYARKLGNFGVGVAVASAGFESAQNRETNIELVAPINLKAGFSIAPDLQYIRNLSGTSGSVWVAGARLTYTFEPDTARTLPQVRRRRADSIF